MGKRFNKRSGDMMSYTVDIASEQYRVSSHNKDHVYEIVQNALGMVDRENMVIRQVSRELYAELDCKELTEDTIL